MKMLNRIAPCTDPWGTLLASGLQLDFVPLFTTLWAWLLSQFSVHLTAHPASCPFEEFGVSTAISVERITCFLLRIAYVRTWKHNAESLQKL